jgi:hypothetical protein
MDLQDIKLEHPIAQYACMPGVIDIELKLINC